MLGEIHDVPDGAALAMFPHFNPPYLFELREGSTSPRRIFVEWPNRRTYQRGVRVKIPFVIGYIKQPDGAKAHFVSLPTQDWVAPKFRF